VKKFLLILGVLYLAIVLLMPKVNLYYTLKKFASDQKITIIQKDVSDRFFDLKISDAKLYYDGIESARIESLNILPWLFYNSLSGVNIKSGNDVKKMFDFKADEVSVVVHIINPFEVSIDAMGNFGQIWGTFFLKESKLRLICEPSSTFKSSQAFRELFQKTDEGYIHESSIK